MIFDEKILNILEQIAALLEANQSAQMPDVDFEDANAFIWYAPEKNRSFHFQPVPVVSKLPLDLLLGISRMKDQLLENTLYFSKGLPANNALLWGARGMGKSSLIKAVHHHVSQQPDLYPLKLIEIHREDISSLPMCLNQLKANPTYRFIVFCDDLSFDSDDTSYKSLKAVLEGGIEGRPENVIFYATSNRRHLMPREMIDNERSSAINPAEAVEEKVSLSDRFGLWIGFHHCSQDDYLSMIKAYATYFGLKMSGEIEAKALEWSLTRGARSGRVAWQFIQYLAGQQNTALKL